MRPILRFLSLLLLTTLACNPLAGTQPTATPALAPNQVKFTRPFISYLKEGDSLPGANVQYVGEGDGGWRVTLDGVPAVKKVGDSLNWKGPVAPGITLDYKLRVIGLILGQFEATGALDIIVDDPAMFPGPTPEEADLYFNALVINTTARRGGTFPGIGIGYVGKTEQGAQITGVEGFAYRQVGDSIDWTGQIRPNAWLKVSLRVTDIGADELKAAGTGEIWIDR